MPNCAALSRGGVRDGFDHEDERQERDLGRWQSEQRWPGDRWKAWMRSRRRVAFHRRREARWHTLRVPMDEKYRAVLDRTYQTILVHEILDLLPFAVKEDVLKVLLTKDGRLYRKAGRRVREALPELVK